MSRVRRAFRHLHRMAEPAAYMFDQPLSALTEREAWAWPHGVSRSVSALTEEGLLLPGLRVAPELPGQTASAARPMVVSTGDPRPSSVSAFSVSPPTTRVLLGNHGDALNLQARRER